MKLPARFREITVKKSLDSGANVGLGVQTWQIDFRRENFT